MVSLKIIITLMLGTCVQVFCVSVRSTGRYYEPFEVPGEVLPDLTAAKLMEAVGKAWQAENLSEALLGSCTRLSPFLYGTQAEEIIRSLCDPIINSRIEESCSDIWRLIIGEGQQYSLIPELSRMCPNNNYDTGSYEWPYSSISNYTTGYNTDDWYPMVAEAEQEGMTMILGLYDVCSENGNGIMKINNIILAVVDVFGPSFIHLESIGPHSICGALRLILGMSPAEYVQNEINILKYPAADGLEFLQTIGLCHAGLYSREMGILKDILVVFSGMEEDEFCSYISTPHTREEYLMKATLILNNIYSTSTDTQICYDVLTIVAPLDTTGILYAITSYNLTFASERNALCAEMIAAFSTSSDHEPTAYTLPPGENLDSWQPFQNPGEFLPNLYFSDLLDTSGAVYRAPTIIAGLGVYCTVYESLLLEYIPVDVFDLAGLCADIRRGDTSALENDCLEFGVPNTYGSSYPIYLRPVNPLSLLTYTVTELLQLRDISESEVCQSIDNLINSQDISLPYVVDFALDIALAEIIPSIPGLCQDFDEIICYLNPPSCPVYPDPSLLVTDYPYFYRPDFEQTISMMESWILSVLGFENRETLCRLVIDDGIDPDTGRATQELVERLKSQIIVLFTDFDRCQDLVDTIFETLPVSAYYYFIRNERSGNLLYKVTGYETSATFCEASTGYFTQAEDQPTDTGPIVAHINVFVKVALYLRELVPS